MSTLSLLIGNKNYSSWSLRPWLLLTQSGIQFEERQVWLFTDEGREQLQRESPSAKVPVLRDGNTVVWESLAICEYLADRRPELWPPDPVARAVARSASAEMHAGFSALREQMPMNCRLEGASIEHSPELERDIERVIALWAEARARFGDDGPMLFGRFSVADAMFAPVVLRFLAYGVQPRGEAGAYMHTMLELPSLQRWLDDARAETHRLPQFEVV
jgi:glutathione S-transferase